MQKRRLAIFAALVGALFFPTTALSAFGVLHSFAGPRGRRLPRRSSRGRTACFMALRPTAATSRFCPLMGAARLSVSAGAARSLRSIPSGDPRALGPRA